jgi:hypothetical protein
VSGQREGDNFSDSDESDQKNSSATDTSGGDKSLYHGEASEARELFMAATETVTSLFKLAVIIRSTSMSNSFLKAASRYPYDAQFDCNHVRARFPKAFRTVPWLVERLGRSITMRRQVLQYRREHQARIETFDIEGDENVPQSEERQELPVPRKAKSIGTHVETKASTYVQPTEDINAGRENQETASIGSQTSYATTAVNEDGSNAISVPPPPALTNGTQFLYGQFFECPYCCTFQNPRDRHEWKYVQHCRSKMELMSRII